MDPELFRPATLPPYVQSEKKKKALWSIVLSKPNCDLVTFLHKPAFKIIDGCGGEKVKLSKVRPRGGIADLS